MAHELYGGSLADFEDSMAEEIEQALNAVRAEEGMEPVPPGKRDMRMLFIAISRGVINHLKKNEQAFQVSVDGVHPAQGFPEIQVKEP